MVSLSKFLRSAEGGQIAFWCPGCDGAHAIQIDEGPGPRWGYNGNHEKPTFTPSVLVRGEDFTETGRADYQAWYAAGCPPRNSESFESQPIVCHSFITDGRIQFLGDCTHALAGQTVNIPDFDEA